MNGKQFIFNAEFDFQLRDSDVAPHIKLAVEQMAPLFIPALTPDDRILSDVIISDDFYHYLQANNLTYAQLIASSKAIAGTQTMAWGWSDSVLETINSLHGAIDAPHTEICRVVNSRFFAHNFNTDNGFGVPYSHVINSKCELQVYLQHSSAKKHVIKPFFGNSGAGFLFIDTNTLEHDLKRTAELLDKEPAIIEPWLERVHDFATLFKIHKHGKVEIIGHHRNVCNNSGSFYGTLICTDDPDLQRWVAQIEQMIFTVAKRLYSDGYFGIVSIDSFTYRDGDREQIAMCVDINCRFTMSYIAHSLYKKIGAPALFYRFIAKRRHKLPETFELFKNQLKEIHYSTTSKKGILIVSPLRIQGADNIWRQPPRSAFCVAGDSIEEVFTLDEALRDRIIA